MWVDSGEEHKINKSLIRPLQYIDVPILFSIMLSHRALCEKISPHNFATCYITHSTMVSAMSDLEIAKEIAAQRREAAKAQRARVTSGFDVMLKAEREAGFIEGVLYGLQHGLSALSKILEQAATEGGPDLPGLYEINRSNNEAFGLTSNSENPLNAPLKGYAPKRRIRGANEELVAKILGEAGSGLTIQQIINIAAFNGEILADSSARVALGRLQEKDCAINMNGLWFPYEPIAHKENPDAPASGELSLGS